MMPSISIIAAVAQNNVIGNANSLIWKLSADLKRFKQLTMGHAIIMGRKTYESIGKALPGRQNIVVSHSNELNIEGCTIVNSLEEAISLCKNESEVFIIGGGQIYQQAIPLANKLYITHLYHTFEGDTFFPEIDANIWKMESNSDFEPDEKNAYKYSFTNYVRLSD